jgi:hypothetical protein
MNIAPSRQSLKKAKAVEKAKPAARRRDPLNPTIFHEPWWLEAATAGRYEEVTVSSGGRTVGRLPYLPRTSFGIQACVMPELSPFLGPAVDEGNGGTVSRNLRRGEITRDLIEKLPPCSLHHQRLHRDTPDALPFMQYGFTAEAVFTYEVAPDSEEALWLKMRARTHDLVRSAQEQTRLVDLEPEAFRSLYRSHAQKRGKPDYLDQANALPVFEAALSRGRGRLLGARDASGNDLAAIFYVWDDDVTYYVLTTRAPDMQNGVVSRLIWEAMRESAAHGRVFDFAGTGSYGSVLFYAAFGGEVRPRFLVQRTTPFYGAIRFTLARSHEIVTNLKVRRSLGQD